MINLEPDLQSLYCFSQAFPGAANLLGGVAGKTVEETLQNTARRPAADYW